MIGAAAAVREVCYRIGEKGVIMLGGLLYAEHYSRVCICSLLSATFRL